MRIILQPLLVSKRISE